MKRLTENVFVNYELPIILVDDLEMAGNLLTSFIKRIGFNNVLTFNCPYKVIECIESGFAPHCIITDFKMPGLNGDQLLAFIKPLCPPFSGIITTGAPELVKKNVQDYIVLQKGCLEFFNLLHTELLAICSKTLPRLEKSLFKTDIIINSPTHCNSRVLI